MSATLSFIDPGVCLNQFFEVPGDAAEKALLQNALTAAYDGIPGSKPHERNGSLFDSPLSKASDQLWPATPRTKIEGGAYVEAELVSLYDAIVFRRICTRNAETWDLDDLPKISDLIPLPKLQQNFDGVYQESYLGSLQAYSVAVDVDGADDEEERKARLLEHAKEFARRVFGQQDGAEQPQAFLKTGAGVLVIGETGQRSKVLLVYPNGTDASFHFYTTLPELFLCHVQLQHIMQRLAGNSQRLTGDLYKAEKARKQLETWLEDANTSEQSLNQLQDFSDDLTTKTAAMVDSVAPLHEHLREIERQREHFQRVVNGSPFAVDAGSLRELTYLLVDRVANIGEQRVRLEIQRSESAERRSEFHRQSLEASIDVREARETNSLNYLVIALTALQIASLLPMLLGNAEFGEWSLWKRLGVTVGAAALLPVLWWIGKCCAAYLRRRKRSSAGRKRTKPAK